MFPSSPHMIHVLEFNPDEGEEGAPITVRIHFHSESSEPIHIRLVVGNKAVSTAVRELPGVDYGRWQLDAAAPTLSHLSLTDNKVLITAQALNAENAILDSVPVGDFSYWECGSARPKPSNDTTNPSPALGRLRAATHLPTPSPHVFMPSPSLSDHTSRTKKRSQKRSRIIREPSLMRARHRAGEVVDEHLHAYTPVLEIVTPLESLCSGWDDDELSAGRRLVRFRKIQDGCRVILSCESIKQEEYRESDIVISCILRDEAETCHVTSVDIIYLLERLTNDNFPVEEKNRIRRNLEGLRPTTVSKHKSGSQVFFQRIMDFPDPKPRNIEKDLKVFEWTLLGQALEKILSKYSIYTSSPTNSTSSLPAYDAPDHLQTLVPPHVEPVLVVTKTESSSESLLFSTHHYESPLSPTLTFFPYGQDAIKHNSDSSSGSWASDSPYPLKDSEAALDVPEHEEANNDDYGYDKYIRDEEMIPL